MKILLVLTGLSLFVATPHALASEGIIEVESAHSVWAIADKAVKVLKSKA